MPWSIASCGRLAFPVEFAPRTHVAALRQLNERRFTGVIPAYNRMDFHRLEFEDRCLQGVRGAETLVEHLEDEKRRRRAPLVAVATLLRLIHRRF
jgi:hypothetical protein